MLRWMLMPFTKYTEFDGRSQRSEYGYFFLLSVICQIAVVLIDRAMGFGSNEDDTSILRTLFILVFIFPSVTLNARRLHDVGRSGWWQLLFFIPIINFALIVYLLVKDSQAEGNEYGPNPKPSM